MATLFNYFVAILYAYMTIAGRSGFSHLDVSPLLVSSTEPVVRAFPEH